MGEEFYPGDVVETLEDLLVEPDLDRGLPRTLIPKGMAGTVLSTFSHPLLVEVEFADDYGRPVAVGHYQPHQVIVVRRAPLRGEGYFPRRRPPWEYLVFFAAALVALFVGAAMYHNLWSPAARAENAALAFSRTAMQGNTADVHALLAPDAALTADRVVALYAPILSLHEHDVRKVEPPRSGAAFRARVVGLTQKQWRVVQIDLRPNPRGGWFVVDVSVQVSPPLVIHPR